MASQHVYDFTQWAQSHPNIAVTHLILLARPKTESKAGWARYLFSPTSENRRSSLSGLLLLLVDKLEAVSIRRNARYSRHLRDCDLSSLVRNSISISPNVSASGHLYNFDFQDVQKVKELDLDLLVRCGNFIPSGGILEAARLGIVSICYADNRTNRGGPAGFWEVYFREDTTGFTINRLNGNGDAGDVLMRGNFATRHYYMLNQAFVFFKSYYYLRVLVEKIAITGNLPISLPNFPYSQRLFREPGVFEVVTYICSRCCSVVIKKMKRRFGIHYRANIAYVDRDWRNAELWRGIKIKNRAFHYLADPFVIYKGAKNYCFVEDYDYGKRRGSIAVYQLTEVGGTYLGIALEEKFHLSFPFLFQYQGELYMCPESSAIKDIRVYKCVEFPLRWELTMILMDNISAVDTMIFQKSGKWWMFTNVDAMEIGDHCSELFIFSACSPLETSWKPHPQNPILVDASRARNAGLVVDGDMHFRISQGQGFDFYGKRVLINQIIELTDTNYRESCLSAVTPSFGDRVVGTHHLHSNGRITVFDFFTSSRIAT